jgi:plastocyanin
MRRFTVLVLACVFVLALAACSSGASTSGTTTGGPAASSVTVTMQNLAFNPAQVDVATGGTVTFVNNDTVQHNVAGDSWSSGPLDPGKSFTQTFSAAGANAIRCLIHPSMTMTVNVK